MIRVANDDDFDYIKSVMFDDEMWSRCSDDYSVKHEDTLKTLGCMWLICSQDNSNVGLASLHVNSNCVVDVHIYIPKIHRGKVSLLCGREILSWIASNADNRVNKINTKIPSIYKDVINFASRLGFKKEGVDSKSISKNHMFVDRVCMGILRKDITT